MPLPIAHGLLGASLVAALHPRPERLRRLPLLAGALLANAADLDFALVFALHSKGWHRGFTHSLAFGLAVCVIFVLSLGRRRAGAAVAYGLAYASHGVLDWLTTLEGGGVELLWPFSPARLGLGWVGLSELPSRVPPSGVLKFLAVELALFTPLLLLVRWARRHVGWRAGAAGGAA